jgi:hypothetical protein
MNLRFLVMTVSLTALSSGLRLNAGQQPSQMSPGQEALGGLDPVRLVQGDEVDGKDALSVTHHGLVYAGTGVTLRAYPRVRV